MKIVFIIQTIYGFLIPTYTHGSMDEINTWKQTHPINSEIQRAVESVYLISILKAFIPLDINLNITNISSIASLTLELLSDEDLILMDTIFDPENKNKIKTALTPNNVFETMFYILVNNVVEIIKLNEASLMAFRQCFEKKYIFISYNTKFIHVIVNQQVMRLTLPEYLYLGAYSYSRSKPNEMDFDKKVKCIIKTAKSYNSSL